MDEEIQKHCAVKVQAAARAFIARQKSFKTIQERFEKIYDPRREEYYYYDTKLDVASWDKPLLLRDKDILSVAQTYTDDEAALMIQRQLLRRSGLRKVRMLYQKTVVATYDEGYEATYYFNPVTEHTTWELPEFMNHKLDYTYDDLPLGGKAKVMNDDSSSSEESEDSEVSIDSEIVRARRREKRRYPRSKAQVLLDKAEDNARTGLKHLSISDCGIDFRVSDRIWDLTNLVQLSLSKNKLRKLSTKVEYLVKLVELDISHNMLTQLPRQIADLSLLRIFNASYNRFRKFTGFLYKCSKLETVNLEGNRLRRLPITVGNLELLKVTKQWEVGFGVLKNLKVLNLSKNLFNVWPEQVDRNSKLQELNLSNNYLRRVPLQIKKNTSLQVLDLSNNLLRSLPTAIYSLPLRRLILRHNCLEELPAFPAVTTASPEFRMEDYTMKTLVYLDVSYNRLSALGEGGHLGLLGPGLKRLYANDNIIESVDLRGLAKLAGLIDMNLARNKIKDSIEEASVKLTALDMSENLLEAVPPFLLTAAGLLTLNLSGNMISRLPDRLFGSCVLITSLDLHNNQIHSLPNNLFALRKVEYVDLSFNRIAQAIPRMLENFTELHTLLLSNNAINELPDSIGALACLEVLEVEDNKLTQFPDEGVMQLAKLKRVTTKRNDIKIRPWSLFQLPALLSWDMSWNRDIVCRYIDWDDRERLFQNDRDIASLDFLGVLLKRANRSAGYEPTERLESNDILVSAFDYFEAKQADEQREEALEEKQDEQYRQELKEEEKQRVADPDAKKKRKKKKPTVEERRAERVLEAKTREEKALSDTLQWQQSFLAFFKRHLVRYSSTSNALTEKQTLENVRRVEELQSTGLRMLAVRTSVQIMTSLRAGEATCVSHPDPLKALGLVTVAGREERDFSAVDETDRPSTALVQSLDLGNGFQEAIASFERIIKELGVVAAVGHLEAMGARAESLREMHTRQWEDKYGKRVGTPFKLQPPISEETNEMEGSGDEVISDGNMSDRGEGGDGERAGGTSLITARSAQFTARTNNSEANELMGMALGELLGGKEGEEEGANDARATTAASRKWPTLEEYLLAKAETASGLMDTVQVDWNEVTLEFECAEKSARLVDYSVPPSILHAPFLHTPDSPTTTAQASLKRLRLLAFRSYFGLGMVLLRRADALTVSIRRLEVAGEVGTSCLDVAQRLGLDYADLVTDVTEEVWDRVQKEDGKAQGSMIERKNRQMQSLMSMSGADGMDLEIDKEGPGEDVDEGENANASEKEEKEKKKKYYQQMKAQKKEAEDKATQERAALEDDTPSATDQYIKLRPPPALTSAAKSVSQVEIVASARYIYKLRRLVVAWADQVFDAAAELLKLEGWDVAAVGTSFADDNSDEEDDDQYAPGARKKGLFAEEKPYDINIRSLWDSKKRPLASCMPVVTNATLDRVEIRAFYLMRARSLQYSQRFDLSITQYNNVLALGGNKKALQNAEMELCRLYVAKKDYEGAHRCLRRVILDRIEGADKRFPEAWQLIRPHPLLAYFLLLTTEGMRMQSFCGFKTMRAAMTFEITADGTYRRRKPIRESEEPVEARAVAQKLGVAVAAAAKKKTKAANRVDKDASALKRRIKGLLYDYKIRLEEAKAAFAAVDKNF